MKTIGDMNTVRAQLLLRGWRSVSAWAVAHGYVPVTARRAIRDWGTRKDRMPHGGINRAILIDLQKTFEKINRRG